MRFILGGALVVAFALEASAQIPLPPDRSLIISECFDESDGLHQYVGCYNKYGGGGVEPMLDVQVSLLDEHPFQGYFETGSSTLTWRHRVQARAGLPPGYNGEPIPIQIFVAYEATTTQNPNATAQVSISVVSGEENGGVLTEVTAANGSGEPSIGDSTTFDRAVTLGNDIITTQTVSFSLSNDVLQGSNNNGSGASEVQAIVDPFITIDPDWEFASDFGVFGTDGVEFSRDWRLAPPVPTADRQEIVTLTFALIVAAAMLIRRRSGASV